MEREESPERGGEEMEEIEEKKERQRRTKAKSL